MAKVVCTVKIMPDSPQVNLKKLETDCCAVIEKLSGKSDKKITTEPVAFGLNALIITFVMDESLGSPDTIESDILAVPGVSSWQVTDCRRAIG
jgi:elongation factor 1-beta